MAGTSGKKDHPGEKGPYRGKIKLSGREVEYTVRVSPRARNVRLRVGIGIGLEVIAPGGFKPGKNLEEILRQNHKWILNKLDMISRVAQSRTKPGQKDPGSILYRGREYRIATAVDAGRYYRVELQEDKVIVILPGETGASPEDVLEAWMREEAREIIGQRAREFSRILNLSYNRIFIRDQKTRWGSCSRKGNLNFNWRLAMAPPEVLDYVVVHELLHLVEPNHSKKFWDLVEKACPEYRVRRAWLRKNGPLLNLY